MWDAINPTTVAHGTTKTTDSYSDYGTKTNHGTCEPQAPQVSFTF